MDSGIDCIGYWDYNSKKESIKIHNYIMITVSFANIQF